MFQKDHDRKIFRISGVICLLVFISSFLFFNPKPVTAQPMLDTVPLSFDMALTMTEIGPGSGTTLRMTLTNSNITPVDEIQFSLNLPVNVTMIPEGNYSSDCSWGNVTIHNDQSISFYGASLITYSSCVVEVDITSSTAGTHLIAVSDLSTSAGISSPDSVNLTVNNNLPSFLMEFSEQTVYLNQPNIITYTIDNSRSSSGIANIYFMNRLPDGLILDPELKPSTTCPSGTITFDGNTITFSAFSVNGNSQCSIQVAVLPVVHQKTYVNKTFAHFLLGFSKASFALEFNDEILLTKSVSNTTLIPGDAVTLTYQLKNLYREDQLTDIQFAEDYIGVLPGISIESLPADGFCGPEAKMVEHEPGKVMVSGATLTGGGECSFQISIRTAEDSAGGSFGFVSSPVTAKLNHETNISGKGAYHRLILADFPSFTKAFVLINDPVFAGDTVEIQYHITNNSNDLTIEKAAFEDILGTVLGNYITSVSATASETCSGVSFQFVHGSDINDARFVVSNFSVSPETTCDFVLQIRLPDQISQNEYVSTTEPLNFEMDSKIFVLNGASATLHVYDKPVQIQKSFSESPAAPGDEVVIFYDLAFANDSLTGSAENISFVDDLNAIFNGITITEISPIIGCGSSAAATGVGTGNLGFTQGVLNAGERCSFRVTAQLSAETIPGSYTPNGTFNYDYSARNITETIRSETLFINGLQFSATVSTDPIFLGSEFDVTFVVENMATSDFSYGSFSIDSNLWNGELVAKNLPMSGFCGTGSSIFQTYSGIQISSLSVPASSSCQFSIRFQLAYTADDLAYFINTSPLTGYYPSFTSSVPGLSIDVSVTELLTIEKRFLNDPILPGGATALEYTLINHHPTETISALTFTDLLVSSGSAMTTLNLQLNNVCGDGSTVSGVNQVQFSGGSLLPGETCRFTVNLQTSADLSAIAAITSPSVTLQGNYQGNLINVKSDEETLNIQSIGLTLTTEPVHVTGSTMLVYEFTNQSLSEISFAIAKNISTDIEDLTFTGNYQLSGCGNASVTFTDQAEISVSAINLAAGETCTISAEVRTGAKTQPGIYPLSSPFIRIGSNNLTYETAVGSLQVNYTIWLINIYK